MARVFPDVISRLTSVNTGVLLYSTVLFAQSGNLRNKDERMPMSPAPSAKLTGMSPQFLVADLDRSIRFYTEQLGFDLDFRYEHFYAGIVAGRSLDPSQARRRDARREGIPPEERAPGRHVYGSRSPRRVQRHERSVGPDHTAAQGDALRPRILRRRSRWVYSGLCRDQIAQAGQMAFRITERDSDGWWLVRPSDSPNFDTVVARTYIFTKSPFEGKDKRP